MRFRQPGAVRDGSTVSHEHLTRSRKTPVAAGARSPIQFLWLCPRPEVVRYAWLLSSEIDHIILGDASEALEQGPLAPETAIAVARVGDVFQLGPHRIVCGDTTDPSTLARLLEGDAASRLILTDEPYNAKIAGNVTGRPHREFAMASGEMTSAEFLAFNEAWMAAVLPHLCDGGILGTFIDWRGSPTVHSAAAKLALVPLNLIVWAKTSAGMGSLYRSQHELLPLFKKGTASHVNNVELGKRGRWRSNVWAYPGASSSAPTPAAASRITQQSSRSPCWRTRSSISAIAATS